MNLDELIYKRLICAEELTKHLARYSGLPAIFNPEAPADNQSGWNGKTHYPRLTFNFDLQANGERKSAGAMEVTLYCENSADIMPERIEAEVRKCLRDVLLKPDEGSLYAFAWARSDAFTLPEEKRDLILGSEIRFDILEYPDQETTDPDPLVALNMYIKELYPDSLVIGMDRLDSIIEASKDRPVFYCRFESVELQSETNTVVWMDCKIAVHLLCPDASIRKKMVMAAAQALSLDGEVILLDRSPMFIKRLQVNYKADYLTDGQLYITGRYGLLRHQVRQHVLTGAALICK